MRHLMSVVICTGLIVQASPVLTANAQPLPPIGGSPPGGPPPGARPGAPGFAGPPGGPGIGGPAGGPRFARPPGGPRGGAAFGARAHRGFAARRAARAAAVGVTAGAVAGAYADRAYEGRRGYDADGAAYCARRYRSYDPDSGTYVGAGGRLYRCP